MDFFIYLSLMNLDFKKVFRKLSIFFEEFKDNCLPL